VRAIVGLLLLSGCAAGPVRSAAHARTELARALATGDAVTLGRLLDVEPASLALGEAPSELADLAAELSAAPLEERASAFAADAQITLVREEDGWRIERGILGAPVLASPEEALGAFARALARVRRSGLGVVLGRRARGVVLEELERWERGLADPLAVPIAVEGATATATLPTGVVVELVEEAGEWRVDDVHE
jgi:hypothetical protein